MWNLLFDLVDKQSLLETWPKDTQSQNEKIDEQSESLISDNHEAELGGFKRRTSSNTSSRCLLITVSIFAAVFISALSGAIAVSAAKLRSRISTLERHGEVMTQPCGSSPAEAVARGCQFDVISFCWLPDACYDAELSEEYRATHKLEWFVDPEKEQPLSYEQIMTGEYTGVYVNWEYHVTHCTAMWKKLHRAILGELGRGAIDGYIGTYEHTKHCEMMLLGGHDVALETINTRIAVKYPDCGIDSSAPLR
ncbi:hypothetical protein F5Y03DRAFT_382804 [Xylaria venustula]|nr:hypothetical protein F5Y03DRAFT_382804 [Xylaria venustula]